MTKFELSTFEKIELENCDPDIKEAFYNTGSGYHQLLPSLIQLNRNLGQLNKNLSLLSEKSHCTEKST